MRKIRFLERFYRNRWVIIFADIKTHNIRRDKWVLRIFQESRMGKGGHSGFRNQIGKFPCIPYMAASWSTAGISYCVHSVLVRRVQSWILVGCGNIWPMESAWNEDFEVLHFDCCLPAPLLHWIYTALLSAGLWDLLFVTKLKMPRPEERP